MKGFDLFAEMRKENSTFSDRSEALSEAAGGKKKAQPTQPTQDNLNPVERAVEALTEEVRTYLQTIKKGLGKKTIKGFKSVVSEALGVKRLSAKRFQEVIDAAPELEVITKESGRQYFQIVEIIEEEIEPEEESEEIEEDGVLCWLNLPWWEKGKWVSRSQAKSLRRKAYEKRAKAQLEEQIATHTEKGLSLLEIYRQDLIEVVCPVCESVRMSVYPTPRGGLACGACNPNISPDLRN